MIGQLLMANRSITFPYNRAAGPINVATSGSTSIVNSLIADNNSPLPRDRISFRYNYFDTAQAVTGFGPATFNAQGVGTSFAQTREFDLHRYTFGFEKTFLNNRFSTELRVPFNTTLSNNLNLSAGTITGPAGGNAFNVMNTPDQTLGEEGTQFGNLTLIFKGVLYQTNQVVLSGGLGVGIPTGEDTSVRVTDYSGLPTQGQATIQRVRIFDIDNETWALSPFLAVLATPTDRFFSQGFVQFDFPLNTSTVNYTELLPRGMISPAQTAAVRRMFPQAGPILTPPFGVSTEIREQSLAHISWGVGYWLLRDPCRRWITGIAPTAELHYTATLQDAPIAVLPGDGILQRTDPGPDARLVPEPNPLVGNRRNRVELLNVTLGSTIQLGQRATLATGVSLPLRGEDNRTFDWEFHLQFNYYFGSGLASYIPSF